MKKDIQMETSDLDNKTWKEHYKLQITGNIPPDKEQGLKIWQSTEELSFSYQELTASIARTYFNCSY
jgi:hypothetical protein